MSTILLLSAIVLVSMPWSSDASCLCSISGDPHITTCDTKTNFAWQGAGAYSLFKTPDTELQCDFDYPRTANGSIEHQMFTYVSSCRLSYKTAAGCEFTMLTGGNRDQQSIYIGDTKMMLSEVDAFLQKNLPPMGVNIDVDVANAKTSCTMQSQQGPISFEIAPYQVHVTSASASQCSGMCGTCDGKAPLSLTLTDAASIRSYSTRWAADGSSSAQPIQMMALPVGCLRNNGTVTNGTQTSGQQSSANSPSSSIPGSPSSMPGSPSSIPGSPSSIPGSPSSMPGSPSSMPGSPSSMPGSPSSMPGSPSSMPGSPSSIPGSPSSSIPGSPSSMPGSPSSMPGSPSSMPGSPSSMSPNGNTMPTGSNLSSAMGNGNANSSAPSFPTPPAVPVMMPNPQMINDNPVFESQEVLRKVVNQCLCGQPKTRYYKDAIFGRYFENCVYDKSFPGAEQLALSNMMTLHRAISKGFTSNNATMAPMDMNVCRSMILQPVVTKRPDQIPMGQGVSYLPIYTKQNSTGMPDLRPTIMTGTGEPVDECEINYATGSLNVATRAPVNAGGQRPTVGMPNGQVPSSSSAQMPNGNSMIDNGMLNRNALTSNGMMNGMNGVSNMAGMPGVMNTMNGNMIAGGMQGNSVVANGVAVIANGGLTHNGLLMNHTNSTNSSMIANNKTMA